MPGLDGLRAIAVLAVIFFHLGFGWAPGGLLGVGIFFTLSGYLITDILLGQFMKKGAIHLGRFWLGRARRLLPALFLMLLIVIAWVTIFGPAQPDQFRKAVVSAIFYVNNWQQIAANVSYFARFAPEQPLNHLWSLSVEEQFYIFWPFILLVGLRFIHEREDNGLRPKLALWTLALAIASSILMAVLYHPSLDPSRVYYGTDTRAAGLLFGAALAMVWPSRRLSQTDHLPGPPQPRRDGLDRPRDHRDHDLADRRVLPVPLPRRLRRPLAGDGDGADAARPPGLQARQHRRLQTAALDRRPLLRHLPLADAGDRPHLAAGPPRPEPAAGHPPDRRDLHHRLALLEVRRGADPPRRDRPPAGETAPARLELDDLLARGADGAGRRRRALHHRDRRHGRAEQGRRPKANRSGSKKRSPRGPKARCR